MDYALSVEAEIDWSSEATPVPDVVQAPAAAVLTVVAPPQRKNTPPKRKKAPPTPKDATPLDAAPRTWGPHNAATRPAVVKLLERTLAEDTARRPEHDAVLRTLLGIAEGRLPRPTRYEPRTRSSLTSWLMIARMAKVSKYFVYVIPEIEADMRRFVPMLTTTGYHVRVVGDLITADKSAVAAVAIALDRLETAGGRIPKSPRNPAKASIIGFCVENGLSVDTIKASEPAIQRISDAARLEGALGDVFDETCWRAAFENQVAGTMAYLVGLFDARQPLPGCVDKPEVVDVAYITRQVNPDGPAVYWSDPVQAHVRKHKNAFGVRPVSLLAPPEKTVGEFTDSVKGWFAAESGTASLANFSTALNRVLKAHALTDDACMPMDIFGDIDLLVGQAASTGTVLTGRSRNNLVPHITTLAGYARRFWEHEDGLPSAPHEALDFAIRRMNAKLSVMSQVSGIPTQLLSGLRNGSRVLPEKFVENLIRLEEYLGTGTGLARRFETTTDIRLIKCSDYFRGLDYRVRKLLPPGSHHKSDDDLRPIVAQIELNAVNQNRMYTQVLRAKNKFWASIPNVSAEAPVMREIEALITHRSVAVPLDADRRATNSWSLHTQGFYRTMLIRFSRWQMLERKRGGLGLDPKEVSLALMLNWKVIASYMNWLAGRYADLKHVDGSGREIVRGPILTGYDIGFLTLVGSLLDTEFGWIRQHGEVFAQRVRVIEDQLPSFDWLEEVRVRMTGDSMETLTAHEDFDALFSRAHVDRRVMPPEMVEFCAQDWLKACIRARNRIINLNTYLKKLIDKSRDPFEAVRVAVVSKSPMDFLTDIIQRAQDDLPDMRKDPVAHAIAVRDLLMFVILCLTALRSKNLRELAWDPGGGGHVQVSDDGILLTIPWQNFKNLGNWHLFGIPGHKMDYSRLLKDWWNVGDLLEHYIKHCRPVLVTHFAKRLARLAGKRPAYDNQKVPTDTTALFPISTLRSMDEHVFGDIVRSMTRRYHVLDQKTGLPRPGFMFFGPHGVRDVVATHIIVSSEDANRWEFAADLLQTSIAMVQLRYTFRTITNRTSKVDPLFDAQQKRFTPRKLAA